MDHTTSNNEGGLTASRNLVISAGNPESARNQRVTNAMDFYSSFLANKLPEMDAATDQASEADHLFSMLPPEQALLLP